MPRAWLLARRPDGLPLDEDFTLAEIASAPLTPGTVRVRNRWLSVDPYMRGRMRDTRSYVPPFAIGKPMEGGAVGEVIESADDRFAPGDRVLHMLGWRDEAVAPAEALTKLPGSNAPEQHYLGLLGMPGMTAYFGLLAVAEAQPGDTVFVSAAAGAVGSAVVQIAKLKGMRVIGSAGGAEKIALLRSLGADAVIDYRAVDAIAPALAQAAPEGIDVYFDNVGGDHLDAALGVAKDGARFAMCGMIDNYNAAAPVEMRNLMRIVAARVRLRGFIVFDFADRFGACQRDMAGWFAAGQLRPVETIRDGLETMPQTFRELFSGGNVGKMLVRL
ncbi:NADP-dependent oxidoreductase [Sphingomonas profundi]|uniref:NADP-dependent oxidoreductase n=1 Tax=Alterirhizorhabdus profundi TaxID=2681549 RepID=UPI0012E73BEF|nr:NADP-dependent oxidoreductase [Sphingomonas profundi]